MVCSIIVNYGSINCKTENEEKVEDGMSWNRLYRNSGFSPGIKGRDYEWVKSESECFLPPKWKKKNTQVSYLSFSLMLSDPQKLST